MADHLDEPGLMSPGGDPSIDITDVYAFKKASQDKSILVMAVNPLTLAPGGFNHRALYQLAVDTNGDARADIAFNITFSKPSGAQRVKVRRARGDDARENEPEGETIITGRTGTVATQGPYKLFAGRRSDPFFFDLAWFLAGLPLPHPTGVDFFALANVDAIVLEVPNSALGTNANVGIWGRTLLPEEDNDDDDDDDGDHDDDFVQIERMGRPAINTVFMKGSRKREFNRGRPHNDPAEFTADVVGVLTTLGGALGGTSYTATAAAGLAGILLPDILTYNYASSGGFLNGRKLDDDVIDIELGLVTNGARTTDGVGVHGDLLAAFPFLGPPH